MRTSTRKQNNTKRIKYIVFAIMSLLSLIAYTMHNSTSQATTNGEQIPTLGKLKAKAIQHKELLQPFAQRWNKVYAQVEDYLADEGFEKTRFFLDGEVIASNDVFELPTEETGAGLEQYVQDLNDAVIADMVPNRPAGGGAFGGGIGGGAAGGGNSSKNQPQYLTIGDPGAGESNLSAVPVPPAIWLLSTTMLGLVGLRRK
jgi:hypothetical protein